MAYTPQFDKMLRKLFLYACPGTGSRTLYVSGTGSDSNSGLSPSLALRQISTALGNAQPGDLIEVDNGTYSYVNPYGVNGSGDQWITVMAKAGANPQISVNDSSGNDGIDIQQSSFLGFYGLEVYGNQNSSSTVPSGICIFRGSHHIRCWANLVHDFPGGGINCFWIASSLYNNQTLPAGSWDVVDLSFNTIHSCCKYSSYNTSGISFFGAIDITSGGTWDGLYAYQAIGNYIYDCECTVPYTPGGLDYVTDGNGISVDSLWVTNNIDPSVSPYSKYGLIEGNIVVGCGGRGLHIYNSINVDDIGNTYIGNLMTDSPAINNGVEADASYTPALQIANNVNHCANIICPLNTPNTTDGVSTYTNCVIVGGTQAIPAGNIDRKSYGVDYFSGQPIQSDLGNGLSLSEFAPVINDVVSVPPTAHGYQALGAGGRPMLTYNSYRSWQAGALQPTKSAPILA